MAPAALLRLPALALLVPLARAVRWPAELLVATSGGPQGQSVHNCNTAAFLHPSSPSTRHTVCPSTGRVARPMSLAPDYFVPKDDSPGGVCYVPPYGTVSRSSSSIVLGMAPYSDIDAPDDRFRKKMAERQRVKDPVIQDFGDRMDWEQSKTGLGRMGDDKLGDDAASERFGPGPGMGGDMLYDDRRPPPPPMMRDEEMFDGDGGNYWVNPRGGMDRYDGGRRGRPRGRGRRGRDMDEDGEWWETRPRGGFDGEFDDEFEFDGNEYGVPPPSRSRSSFRSGAPPPPRPVKQFYDKLFWFGFDPDVTRPTDRTMFGGTRGKFNAMDLLSDREERQRLREGGGMMRPRRRGRRTGMDPVVQDFGSVRDWNASKMGGGRTGGDAVGDDRGRPNFGYGASFDGRGVGPAPFPGDMPPPPPPPGMPEYDLEPGLFDDIDFDEDRAVLQRRRSRGGRRRRRDNRRRNIDRRAMEYDRFLGGGDEYVNLDDDFMPGRMPSRGRRGFAYKYRSDDLFDDDDEFIDVEATYASERDLEMARGLPSRGRRRRSWEERAIEMDRVPPRGAVAWGPEGQIGSGDPLEGAAMDALRDIKKSKRYLEDKEEDVEEAKEEVVQLKADATVCEEQLEDARGGEVDELEEQLGYLMRDVDDASRNLRLARAKRDAASDRVSALEERNWALLSEYDAARSFEDDMD